MTLATFRERCVTDPTGVPLMTSGGREELCAIFAGLVFKEGAEIGVWEGAFSRQLCLSVPGLHLRCVDPWRSYEEYQDPKNQKMKIEKAYRTAVEKLTPLGCDIMRMTSLAAAAQVPDGSLDFVYLDGNHGETFVTADLHAWAPKVRRGGIVSGHDYMERPGKSWIQVKAAVDAYTSARNIGPVYILNGDKAPSFFWVVA